MSDSAFVAGATGFTGREVVRRLRDKGVPTVAHVRPDSPRLDEWRARFEGMGASVDTTPWAREVLTATLRSLQPAWVFGLLGTVRARMKLARAQGRDPQSESYEAVDYGLTRMLLEAARDCGSSPRFIYLSAAGVKRNATNPYYRARARIEQSLAESGLGYCIARPSFITGPDRDDRRPLERAGAAVADGLLRAAGRLGARKWEARYSSTTNGILAEALVRMALAPEPANRVFESEELRGSPPSNKG